MFQIENKVCFTPTQKKCQAPHPTPAIAHALFLTLVSALVSRSSPPPPLYQLGCFGVQKIESSNSDVASAIRKSRGKIV